MFPAPNLDYNQQVASIEAQIANLRKASQQPGFNAQAAVYSAFSAPHKVMPVDGIAGAEAAQKELPPGSSDIVAHRTEDIIYLIARDDNGVPLPIKPARIEWIEPQNDPTGYVTKKDLEDFKADLLAIVAQKGETT